MALDLDGKTGKISDPDLAEFYMLMIKGMTAGRVIITCGALPADALTLPARTWQWKLEGLGQAAFIRYLLRDEAVADRYRKGEISYAELAKHHLAALGHPAHLAQTGKALSWEISPPTRTRWQSSPPGWALPLATPSSRQRSLA